MDTTLFTWGLALVATVLMGFMAWVGSTLVGMKTDIAVLTSEIKTHDKSELKNSEKINILEQDVHKIQTDIEVIKNKISAF